MYQDKYRHSESVISPARNCFAITPSDDQKVSEVPKAIYVGTGGDIVLNLVDGDQDVHFRNVQNGTIIAVCPQFIRTSGTSASDIVGLI